MNTAFDSCSRPEDRRRCDAPQWSGSAPDGFRSEAFAEDLDGLGLAGTGEAAPPSMPHRSRAMPLLAAGAWPHLAWR